MQVISTQYTIKPNDGFTDFIIFEKNKTYKIGVSFIDFTGRKSSWLIYQNKIVNVFDYLNEFDLLSNLYLHFNSYSECEDILKDLSLVDFKENIKHKYMQTDILLIEGYINSIQDDNIKTAMLNILEDMKNKAQYL